MIARLGGEEQLRRIAPFAAVVLAGLLALVVPARGRYVSVRDLAAAVPPAARAAAPPTSAPGSGSTRPADVPVGGGEPFANAAPPAALVGSPSEPPSFAAPASDTALAPPDETTPAGDAPAAAPSPLRVTDGGWADLTAPAPSTQPAVPADALPIAATAGQDQRRSFVRVAGDSTTLTLPLADAASQRMPETGAVRACLITTAGWKGTEGGRFADAPAFDPNQCVDGTAGANGLTFDLSTFANPSSTPGFALVPSPKATGATWQITLRRA